MKPKVRGTLTVEEEVDLTYSLDGWTLAELEEYAEQPDDEGLDCLKGESHVISRDYDSLDYAPADLAAYIAWRAANGLTERMT